MVPRAESLANGHIGTNGTDTQNGHLVRVDEQPLHSNGNHVSVDIIILDASGRTILPGLDGSDGLPLKTPNSVKPDYKDGLSGHVSTREEPEGFDQDRVLQIYRAHPGLGQYIANLEAEAYLKGVDQAQGRKEERQAASTVLPAVVEQTPIDAALPPASKLTTQESVLKPRSKIQESDSVRVLTIDSQPFGFRAARGIKAAVNVFNVAKYSIPRIKEVKSKEKVISLQPMRLSEIERLRAEYGYTPGNIDNLIKLRAFALDRQMPIPDFAKLLHLTKEDAALFDRGYRPAYRKAVTQTVGIHRAMRWIGIGRSHVKRADSLTQSPSVEAEKDSTIEQPNFSSIAAAELGTAPHTNDFLGIGRKGVKDKRSKNPRNVAKTVVKWPASHVRDLALAGTAVGGIAFGVYLADQSLPDGYEEGNVIRRRSAAERATELPSPLTKPKVSTFNGTALILNLIKLQQQVDLLPKGTSVTIGESIPYPDDPDLEIRNDLFILTSGSTKLEYLDEELAQKAQFADVDASYRGALKNRQIKLNNYSPNQPVEVTFTRSDGVLVANMDFEADYVDISDDDTVQVLVERDSAIRLLKASGELTEVAKRFNSLDLGKLVVLNNWPEDADNEYYTYIPGVGPAVNAEFSKLSKEERAEILYRAFAKAVYHQVTSEKSDAVDQFNELHDSLVDDALHGLEPESGLHQNAFEVLDDINHQEFLQYSGNYQNKEAVFIEAFSSLFLRTDALLVRYGYADVPCREEQDSITANNTLKIFHAVLLLLKNSYGQAVLNELLKDEDVVNSLVYAGFMEDGYDYERQENTQAEIHQLTQTPGPTRTPNPYHSPTTAPLSAIESDDTEFTVLWQGLPTFTPTATSTATTEPTRDPYRSTPTPRSLTDEETDEESGSANYDIPQKILPSRTPKSTSTATAGPSRQQICDSISNEFVRDINNYDKDRVKNYAENVVLSEEFAAVDDPRTPTINP
ncbi:MAG: hypothetical protein HYV40_00705 [Candidatus Levybacteria bacterium]|nr:hypothetical protein [Candidatus Levybacteria bacterium]